MHKVKEQKIKGKMFSLKKKGSTLYTLTRCHYKTNKQKKTKKKKKLQGNPSC